jgi:hypothetical protein
MLAPENMIKVEIVEEIKKAGASQLRANTASPS